MLEIELAFSIEQKCFSGQQRDVRRSKDMTGIMNLKEMFRSSFSRSDSGTGMPNSPSFSDFSMGVGSEGKLIGHIRVLFECAAAPSTEHHGVDRSRRGPLCPSVYGHVVGFC